MALHEQLLVVRELISATKVFAAAMVKYGVKHKIAITYHLQSNSQAEVSNKEIKKILKKMVNPSRKEGLVLALT